MTVNVAAGTYNEVPRLVGFSIGRPSESASAASLTFTGTLAAPALSTGTTSGALTSASTPSGTTLGTVTDSGQSWTVNQLRGQLLLMTSGTNSGTYFVIESNTATTLTLAAATGTFAVGATYSLLTPASIFTGGALNVQGNHNGTITFQNFKWAPTSGSAFSGAQNSSALTFTRNQFVTVSTGTAFSATSPTSNTMTLSTCYITHAVTGGLCGASFYGPGVFSLSSSFVYATGASNTIALCLYRPGAGTLFSSSHLQSSPTTEGVIEAFHGALSGVQMSVTLRCNSAGNGNGLLFPHPGETSQGASGTWAAASLGVEGCAAGLSIAAPVYVSTGTLSFTNVTTGVSVSYGGVQNFRVNTPTFSTVTNELQVDGVNYTWAAFNALSPKLITGPYQSSLVSY